MLYTILSKLKSFFIPIFCISCKNQIDSYNSYESLCFDCKSKIKPIISTNISLSNAKSITVHAISEYKNPVKLLVLQKSKSNYLASIQIAHLIWELSNIKDLDFDYLIPIPLHWTRYALRGYNQSEVIAKELSKLSKKPILNCLKRVKKTEFQAQLNKNEKASNVYEAFELKINAQYMNEKFMLVDDVITSGSTLKEAGKVLLKLKPSTISAIVACKTLN